MTQGPRVAVIGLDCGTPQLLFDRLADEVPNINALIQRGMHGELASVTPPITIPAWACAMSGRTPGRLGIYGMRNRKDTSYEGLSIATSAAVKEPQVWDVLGRHGMKSLLIGVPPGYPPRPVEGWRVSCFLTPPSAETFTHPLELAAEIEEELGDEPYIFDIPNFRLRGEDVLLDQVFKMTERRFRVARRFVREKPWDFFMLVEMGADRLHHVFWQHFDPSHPKYEPGNRFETAFQDYYRFLDGEVGSLLEALPDDAVIVLMSDHGARPMTGGVCFNEWLAKEGYLRFEAEPDGPTAISKARIDWPKTTAWGDGGYYGRLFLNVRGREPEGVVEPSRYEGPTGIVGVVHDACRETDLPSVSLWAAVPHYVSLAPSPRAALALVRRFGELLKIDIDLDELEEASEEYSQQVSEAVSSDAETAAYVEELERRVDMLEAADDLPSGDSLAAELSRFLQEREEEDDGSDGPDGPAV